ncbi:MAG: peptidoglycan DD-metalloendopeptidase family protein [Pseudomonadota bacterium]
MRTLICIFSLWLLAASVGWSQQPSQRELETVRARIAALGQSMASRTRERSTLQATLRTTETKLAAAETDRRNVARQQQRADERLRAAEERLRIQQQALASERNELARQLRAAYVSGQQERIKLVLNQGSPASIGRLMQDYRYLNTARLGNLESLTVALVAIQTTRADIQSEQQALSRLASRADTLISQLRKGRSQRQQLLQKIDRELVDQEALLAELNQREQDLANIIAELSNILADYPVNAEAPLSDLRGKLTWPVAGDMVTRFGQRRRGDVSSKAVVLATDAGADVRSIYHGRIVFADWLPGMGLLLIIDHGDSMLSLYGYNESLLKAVGDWVTPGEVIATVGNTGGQREPALYFEMRRGTRALNPSTWFRNRPTRQRR